MNITCRHCPRALATAENGFLPQDTSIFPIIRQTNRCGQLETVLGFAFTDSVKDDKALHAVAMPSKRPLQETEPKPLRLTNDCVPCRNNQKHNQSRCSACPDVELQAQ